MCTTTQYFFCCGHTATHRFRNQLCSQSKGRICRIRDTNRFIEGECRKCQQDREEQRQQSRMRAPATFEDIWYIPTRCFVDVGFRTLDPFMGSGDMNLDPISPLTVIPPLLPLSAVSPKAESCSGALKSPVERVLPRFRRHKNTRPCCEDLSLADAFQAVRLEDYDARPEGRIMDNHCESVV